MSWAGTAIAVSVASGAGSVLANSANAKRTAARAERIGMEQAASMRDRMAVSTQATQREIEALRTLRAADIPAFQQAAENALYMAQRGYEKQMRARTLSALPGDVKQNLFGQMFNQYIASQNARFQNYAALTQQIMQATERQQQMAFNIESTAGQYEMQGRMTGLQYRDEAGKALGGILAAVGSAAGQFGKAQLAKDAAGTQATPGVSEAEAPTTGFDQGFDEMFPKIDFGEFNIEF